MRNQSKARLTRGSITTTQILQCNPGQRGICPRSTQWEARFFSAEGSRNQGSFMHVVVCALGLQGGNVLGRPRESRGTLHEGRETEMPGGQKGNVIWNAQSDRRQP